MKCYVLVFKLSQRDYYKYNIVNKSGNIIIQPHLLSGYSLSIRQDILQ